jgi:hypothetical protein
MLASPLRYELSLRELVPPRILTVEREGRIELGSEIVVDGRRWRLDGFDEETGHLICSLVP